MTLAVRSVSIFRASIRTENRTPRVTSNLAALQRRRVGVSREVFNRVLSIQLVPKHILDDPRLVRGTRSLDMALFHFLADEMIDANALAVAVAQIRRGEESVTLKAFDYHTEGWAGHDFAQKPLPGKRDFAATLFHGGAIVIRQKKQHETGRATIVLDFKQGEHPEEVIEKNAKWWADPSIDQAF